MKTEIQIAEGNVESLKDTVNNNINYWSCVEHLSTLKRWLEFLAFMDRFIHIHQFKSNAKRCSDLDEKITDIQKTIKYYKENKIE